MSDIKVKVTEYNGKPAVIVVSKKAMKAAKIIKEKYEKSADEFVSAAKGAATQNAGNPPPQIPEAPSKLDVDA